ncbi:MAG: peptidase dimerization domain-containing protein [Kiritimatiellae bacterium]|nr:peptidase dimerization domain-containing protein [Kiritimatiellia bacterium]MCB1101024.1 peptidase dimerization domain-containing protein [Kiritimatiellia bacterium]
MNKQTTKPNTGFTIPDRASLAAMAEVIREHRELALGNILLLSEIPAPPFHEQRRIQEFMHRLIECGIQNCSVDDRGNGIGILPGTLGDQSILVAASADCVHDPDKDYNIAVQPGELTGYGVSDSLGISALATLPSMLDHLGIQLKSNLVLLATARSSGRGNLEGIRYFLRNFKQPLPYGICLKGSPLGRLSYTSIGMLRGDIVCTVPPEYDWTRFGAASAVMIMNQIISKIVAIPLPRKPQTSIILGSIEGGSAYDRIARKTVLKLEIRGEDAALVKQVGDEISDIVAETESESGAEVSLDIFAQREPGGIRISHPVVRSARQVMEGLDIKPLIMPSTSETSALIDQKIPAITLGLAESRGISEEQDTIDISSLHRGLAQLIGVLVALDGGAAS